MVTGVYGDECISEHTAFIYDRGGRTRVVKARSAPR